MRVIRATREHLLLAAEVVCLGTGEAKWTARDGVYSFRNQIQPPRGKGALPPGARVVFFHGAEAKFHLVELLHTIGLPAGEKPFHP